MESLEGIYVESLEGITRLQSTGECSCGGGHVNGDGTLEDWSI